MVVRAAASAAAVDPSQPPVNFGRAPSSAETVISNLVTTKDNGVAKEADRGGNGQDGSIVGQLETGFVTGQDESTVGCREQQAEVPGGNVAVAPAVAFAGATVGATGPPARQQIVGETDLARESRDGDETTPPKLVKRGQTSNSTSGARKGQQHEGEEELVFPKHLGEAANTGSADDGLRGVNERRSLNSGHEQGPHTSVDGHDAGEVGLEAMIHFTKYEDGRGIQEGSDDGRGVEAKKGVANNGCGSVSAEGRAAREWSNGETRHGKDSESEEEEEGEGDNENENKEGEEGPAGDEAEPAKTDEENRFDLEAAVDSLQSLLVRHYVSGKC